MFKLKVRMTPNKINFKSKYGKDLTCKLCKDENSVEDLPHLLACPFLVGHPKLSSKINSIKIDDIFGNLESQVKAVKIWDRIFKIYESENEK